VVETAPFQSTGVCNKYCLLNFSGDLHLFDDKRRKFMYIISERLHPRLRSFILPQALAVRSFAGGQYFKRIFTKCDLPFPSGFFGR
jgi:hypothetical protein